MMTMISTSVIEIIFSSFLLILITILLNVDAYPMPQMRICIQSIDPNRLPSQCIYCKSRTFPLTVRMCTGNSYLPARMTLAEATCLVTTCRKQLPRLPPEPYSLVRPFTINGYNNNNNNNLFNMNNQNLNNPLHDEPSGPNGGNGGNSGGGNNLDLDDIGGATFDETGDGGLLAEQASKVRKPAKFFLGKPQKIQTSIRPLLFG